MKQLVLSFLAILFSVYCNSQEQPTTLKVMTWNILHGANDIENGPQKVIEIIREIDPDIVFMIETYGSGPFIADALQYHFHLIAPEGTALNDKNINLSMMSKYPFGKRIDTEYPFYLGGREVLVDGKEIRCLVNWFHYLPWDDAPAKMNKTAKELLRWERSGKKHEMIQKVWPYLKKYAAEADSIPMIFGGDMNTYSHLDWGKATRKKHNNLIVSWHSTKMLEKIGLTDTFRALNPDPLKHPGITWDTKDKNDEHRIDYIFYKGPGLAPIRSETFKAFLGEPLRIHGKKIIYPSDHGIVVTSFEIRDH